MKKFKIYIVAAITIIAFGIVYAQWATPTYTTHYKLRMYSQGQQPGADSLNKNTRVIDSLLYAAMTGATRPDTTLIFYKSDTTKYLSIYRLDTSAVGFLNQRNTYTKRNLFSDSIRGTGQVNFDSMKVAGTINTSILNATGSVIGANFIGVGTYLTSIDAEQLINEIDNDRLNSKVAILGDNLDTSKLLYRRDTANSLTKDTLKTNLIHSKNKFFDVVEFLLTTTFNGVATFLVSPVFSSLVNFANGITVTGYSKIGDLAEYEKTKVIRMYLDSTGWNRVDHGFTGWGFKNILSTTIMVLHDTTAGSGRMLPGGSNLAVAITPGVNIWIDSLKINYSLPTTATGLLGDTAYFRIVYGNIY